MTRSSVSYKNAKGCLGVLVCCTKSSWPGIGVLRVESENGLGWYLSLKSPVSHIVNGSYCSKYETLTLCILRIKHEMSLFLK